MSKESFKKKLSGDWEADLKHAYMYGWAYGARIMAEDSFITAEQIEDHFQKYIETLKNDRS